MSAHGLQCVIEKKSTKSNKQSVAQAKTIEYFTGNFLRTGLWYVLISSQNIKKKLMRSC